MTQAAYDTPGLYKYDIRLSAVRERSDIYKQKAIVHAKETVPPPNWSYHVVLLS